MMIDKYSSALAPLVVAVLLAGSGVSHAFSIESFDPDVYTGSGAAEQAAMNTTIGVTGFTIEDFEDATLVSGLTMSPAPAIASAFSNTIWDGTSYAVHHTYEPGIVFNFVNGTTSVGIGVGDVDVEQVHLFVNGQDFGAINGLDNFRKVGDNYRDVYIRIDAGPSEIINSIAIARDVFDFNDGVFIDHLAFFPLPVPVEEQTWGGIKNLFR